MIQGHLQCQIVTSRSSNRKVDFYQIKQRACVIPHFHVILTVGSFYGIMFVIQCDLRDQKVNLKVKCLNVYLYKCQQTSCVIPLFDLILTEESIYMVLFW